MTIQRLHDLREALEDRGCRLLTEDEFPAASRDPFVLVREQIVWGVLVPNGSIRTLTITAYEDLGRPTENLGDIFDCVDEASGAKLHFEKRKDPRWKTSLKAFVWAITETHRPGE